MKTEKISQYFFLLAAVLAILDGAFTLSKEMQSIKLIILVLCGLSVGVLRQSKKESFLVAGIAVIVTGLLFTQLLGSNITLFSGLIQMIINFIVFLSAGVFVVGLHYVANILTGEKEPEEQEESREVKHFKNIFPAHKTFEKVWGYVMLIAVALTFIVLLSEIFFDVSQYTTIILVVDFFITALFITDLFVLYRHANGFSDFLTRNIFDIIAAIPAIGLLRALKIVRVVRFVRVLKATSKVSKMSKLGKLNKTTKFLSEDSYFNKIKSSSKKKDKKSNKKNSPKKKTSAKKSSSVKNKTKQSKSVSVRKK